MPPPFVGTPTQLATDILTLSAKVGRRGERLKVLILRAAPESVVRLELKLLTEAADDLTRTLFGVSAEELTEEK